MTVLATPSPYLRDRLLQAADGLRKDAETARLSLATAEQDVAAALALLEEARQVLAEAEAHRDAQRAKVDTLAEEIAWVEERAAERTPPACDPDAALAATGLMPSEVPRLPNGRVVPPPGEIEFIADDLPGMWEEADFRGGATDMDDLTAPGVADSRAQVAPHLPPPVPHDPAGPLMTMPDLAPRREPLDPPPGEGTHTHAKDRPGFLARLTGGHRTIRDEQDGDQADG